MKLKEEDITATEKYHGSSGWQENKAPLRSITPALFEKEGAKTF
jgi:hypothetical protein